MNSYAISPQAELDPETDWIRDTSAYERMQLIRSSVNEIDDPVNRLVALAGAIQEKELLEPPQAPATEELSSVVLAPFDSIEAQALVQTALDEIANLANRFPHSDRIEYLRRALTRLEASAYAEWLCTAVAGLAIYVREAEARQDRDLTAATPQSSIGTRDRIYHLARAAWIIGRHPDLQSKADFVKAVDQHENFGNARVNGDNVWRAVHRLGLQHLGQEHLPDQYRGGMEPFKRLVHDLLFGELRDK